MGSPDRKLLDYFPPELLLHGTSVPIHLFRRYLNPSSYIAEFGSGDGSKAAALKDLGYRNLEGFELYSNLVELTRHQGIEVHEADVTRMWQFSTHAEFCFDGVYMEGLLCNLIGDEWKRPLLTAFDSLDMGGVIFIADVLSARDENPLLRAKLGEEGYLEWRRKWIARYDANSRIPVLRDGEFLVAFPGESRELEWGTTDQVLSLWNSGGVERIARHINERELNDFLGLYPLRRVYYEYKIWYSRSGNPLSGFVGAWVKTRKRIHFIKTA